VNYEDTFEAVPGVSVEWCEYFGSYQGRMVAKITVDGEDGPQYILDYYGSCSGCDSFEAEFGYRYGDNEPTKEDLAAFGQSYVDAAISLDEAIQQLMPKPGSWYDTEDKEVLDRILKDYPEKGLVVRLLPVGSA
jgi:hypothetical protein